MDDSSDVSQRTDDTGSIIRIECWTICLVARDKIRIPIERKRQGISLRTCPAGTKIAIVLFVDLFILFTCDKLHRVITATNTLYSPLCKHMSLYSPKTVYSEKNNKILVMFQYCAPKISFWLSHQLVCVKVQPHIPDMHPGNPLSLSGS